MEDLPLSGSQSDQFTTTSFPTQMSMEPSHLSLTPHTSASRLMRFYQLLEATISNMQLRLAVVENQIESMQASFNQLDTKVDINLDANTKVLNRVETALARIKVP